MKKKILASILYYSGILWLKLLWTKIFGSRKLRILAYHRVMDIDPENFALAEDVVDATVSDFDRQMKFISRNFNVITFKELAECHKNGGLPKNSLIITFDDGYRDNYTNAFPILKKYNLLAAIFLATGYIGSDKLFWWDKLAYLIKKTSKEEVSISINGDVRRYNLSNREKRYYAIEDINNLLKKVSDDEKEGILKQLESSINVFIEPSVSKDIILSWDEVKEMSQNRIEFGAHTVNHKILPNLSLHDMKKEICSSREEIEKRIGKTVGVFAYPSGLYNDDCVDTLKEADFEFGCSYITGFDNLDHHPYELRRINIDFKQGMNMFKARLCFLKLMSLEIK